MRIAGRSVLNPVHEVAELLSRNLENFQSIPCQKLGVIQRERLNAIFALHLFAQGLMTW